MIKVQGHVTLMLLFFRSGRSEWMYMKDLVIVSQQLTCAASGLWYRSTDHQKNCRGQTTQELRVHGHGPVAVLIKTITVSRCDLKLPEVCQQVQLMQPTSQTIQACDLSTNCTTNRKKKKTLMWLPFIAEKTLSSICSNVILLLKFIHAIQQMSHLVN